MDSWTLQGDSYSFMRSAPRTFSLCHREGTPNHVEIFDIINIPTQRSVISETTCLCDIFGDDGESASLSSSPAAGPAVPSQTELERKVATTPQVDDLNDSSGSYHTAPGSSEGEEGFDDSREGSQGCPILLFRLRAGQVPHFQNFLIPPPQSQLIFLSPLSLEEIECPSHDITSHRVHKAASKEFQQRQEKLHPLVPSNSLKFDRNIYLPDSTCTPQNSRRQLLPKIIQDDRERLAGDMSRRINRRRTPSPPLTRFTPVHIIAPQKPHRKWQNRSNSPSEVITSSLCGNLKEAGTNRENPNVDPVDNNSQAHWVRIGKQLEMDREMPLEQERDVGMERQMGREIDGERKREEQAPEREEGWQGVANYRGEQVELSFNARNRKGPVIRSAAPTTREARQGLPTAHSYSESLPATRQLQQQHSLLKLAPQPDPSGCSTSRRLKPPTSQDRRSVPRRVSTSRPCQSSSSSMGSELDEEDHEVKWLTDVAFRSLSSPEVDYLEMYNSSHCSSTNISQPSTHDSPAGVNAAWLSYADFRGSAPKLDFDELSSHQQNPHNLDCLDPSRRCELGSFECIDVAVEREDCRKVRRGVPKRQIQLKRRNNTEGKQDESSENSSPGLPVMVESPSQEIHPRGTFVRQHSTPAAMQETPPSESSSELSQQKERQSKLQKSASMDETYSKTKIASCLIKNVLSKKMQGVDRQPDEQASEEVSPPTESAIAPSEESPKLDSGNLSSCLQSDHSLSSERFSLRGETGMKDQATLPKDHGLKSSYRPSSSSSGRSVTFSQTDSEEADSQTRSTKSSASEIKSNCGIPFGGKRSGLQSWQTHETVVGAPVEVPAWDTAAPSERPSGNTLARGTNRDQKVENKDQDRQLQQRDKDPYTSKTQEIKLKAVEKKKASLNVCLTPEAESKSFPLEGFAGEKEENAKTKAEDKIKDQGDGDDNVKAPVHKVRDVRRLVKNTYNLSFKAVSSDNQSGIGEENCNEETREEVPVGEKINVLKEASREEREEEREKETIPPSEKVFPDSHRGRTFSSSSTTSGPLAMTESVDVLEKPTEEEEQGQIGINLHPILPVPAQLATPLTVVLPLLTSIAVPIILPHLVCHTLQVRHYLTKWLSPLSMFTTVDLKCSHWVTNQDLQSQALLVQTNHNPFTSLSTPLLPAVPFLHSCRPALLTALCCHSSILELDGLLFTDLPISSHQI
ncbi:hypothetical protein CCH79_00005926 [Gambusia affinis]|uniref:Uncharacterized protein n=1 Tax=Gambusia affinis TaxID=33528 RepID=A0A315VKW4_GAMAF|nr:hypothetical protein CCH79_00005926 [Gambusia affinis]